MSRRSMSPEFDQRIADWLEDDPDHAPESVLSTVRAAFPSIPQRRAWRVPWRFRPMTVTSRLLAGAAAVAVVLVGGILILRPGGSGVAASASPPTLRPTAPAASPSAVAVLDKTFRSDRYGFAVGYPTGWTASRATRSWLTGTQNNWSSGINDELAGTDIRFSGAAQPLASGQTAEAWVLEYGSPVAALAGQGGSPADWPRVTIGGLQGWIDVNDAVTSGGTIIPRARVFDAVVVSGGYGFNFNMDGNVDRVTFDTFLATVTLPDIPALDTTYTSTTLGFSLQRPAAWAVAAASRLWSSGYNYDRASTDEFGGQETNSGPAQFAATSTKIPAGMTFDAWYAAYVAVRASRTCGAPAAEEAIQVDGLVGRLDVHCPTFYFEAVVAKGGRAYVITVYNPETRPVLESILATVKLTPTSAKN